MHGVRGRRDFSADRPASAIAEFRDHPRAPDQDRRARDRAPSRASASSCRRVARRAPLFRTVALGIMPSGPMSRGASRPDAPPSKADQPRNALHSEWDRRRSVSRSGGRAPSAAEVQKTRRVVHDPGLGVARVLRDKLCILLWKTPLRKEAIALQSCSTVRAFILRKNDLSLAKSCSMGLRSGL